MGTHRRRRIRGGRGRRAVVLAVATLVVGVGVLVLAAVRADLAPARLAAGPAPAAATAAPEPTAPAPPSDPLEGTWVGPLADPDTVTVDVRLTVGGSGRGAVGGGVVLEVPGLRCTYRGPDPGRGGGPLETELRADGGGRDACAESARVRLGAARPEGPATDRVRYELVSSCDAGVCTPRRASGVLTAWRPGP